MRMRFLDRLLAALAGFLLFLSGLAIFLWAVGAIPGDNLTALTEQEVDRTLLFVALGLGVVMALLGANSMALLFRRQSKKGFVMQRTEHGQLSISIHAMENLVQKCVDKHQELTVVSNRIENTRDGVVVDLRIGLAGGVSIPLVVNTLQKQIKQYITSCSGIDVKEVRVEVETTGAKAENSPFAVPETLLPTPPKADPIEPPEPVKITEQPVPPAVPKTPPEPKAPEFPEPLAEEKKRPLHQRLFGHKEQPAIVPMPPELTVSEEPVPAEPVLPPAEEAQAASPPETSDPEEQEVADDEKR